jgi:Ca-activated chloride channel family protein
MPACELILDSSGSMEKPIGRTPKFRIAQEVMRELLKSLPDGAYVGLRLYGHLGFVPHRPGRRPLVDPNDPRLKTDSQLVVPINLLDRERRSAIKKAIDAVWPRGDTPLFYSLLQSRADFPAVWGGSRLVILVSDGEDNCGGKIDDVAAAFRDSGIEIKIHVVGFDIQGLAAKQQLEQLAAIGGGRYFDARNAEQLAEHLRQAVASVGYAVYDQDGKQEINRGLINGPPLSLMPGAYRIGIVGSRDLAIPVQLRNRQTVELVIDDSGRLKAPEK